MRALLLAALAAAAVFPDGKMSLRPPKGWAAKDAECVEEAFWCWAKGEGSVIVTEADPQFVWRCGGEPIKAERFHPDFLARAQLECDTRAGHAKETVSRAQGKKAVFSYILTPLTHGTVQIRGYLGVRDGVYKVDGKLKEGDVLSWVAAFRAARPR